MKIKKTLKTWNRSVGMNQKRFVIIHHTATWECSITWVLETLTKGNVSCHYVVDTNGDTYKIGEDDDILWHAWVSCWGTKNMINRFGIGIEVIWPINGAFSYEQRKKVKELTEELIWKYNILRQNVLRHADLTHEWSSQKILWDGKSKSRKVDIDICFLNDSNGIPKYKNWKEWQESLHNPREQTERKLREK